ncbi:hypothetical protein SISNIDRAFT_465677 [Sistotremastrum niveocremeum HHB9708]|uniref:Uncharacterized protein n=1 Tax=Sistotremastrum niveocremeum HHB9708 TaxID=1314777 RepID=A0A164VGY7_9AGAM|nr:hypothetical protein SISNIDRAFT_465677 [Sistotremastrum niveocremeum HHB9708]
MSAIQSHTQIAPTFEASLNVDTRNVPLSLQQQQPRQFPHSMGGPQTMMFPNATQQQFMQSQHSIQSVQQQQSAARAQGMGPLAGSRGPMGPSPAGAQSNQAQSLTNGPAQFNSMEPRDMANLMMQNSGGSMTMPMSGLPSQAPFPSALVAQSQGPIQGPAMQRRMAVNPQGTSIGVSHTASQRHTPMNIASQGMGIGMGLGPATSLPIRTQTAAPQQMGQSMRIPQNVQNVPNMQNIQQADLQRMFAQQQQQQGSPALRAQQRPVGQGQQVQAFQQHFAAAEMATQNGLVRPMSTQPTGQRMIPQGGQSMPHHPGHMVNSQQFVNVSVSARAPNSSAQHLVPSLNQPPVLAQANPAALQSMQQRTRTPYQAGLSTPSLVHATHHPRPQSSHASPPSRPPSHAGTPVLASASAPNGVPMRAQQSTPEVFPGGSNTIFQNALSHNNGARMPQNDPSPTQYRFDRPSTTGPSGVQTHLQSPSQQHQAVARGQQPAFLPKIGVKQFPLHVGV